MDGQEILDSQVLISIKDNTSSSLLGGMSVVNCARHIFGTS